MINDLTQPKRSTARVLRVMCKYDDGSQGDFEIDNPKSVNYIAEYGEGKNNIMVEDIHGQNHFFCYVVACIWVY